MHVAIARVTIHLAGNQSLKGKRQVLQSLTSRLRQRFNIAAAEVAAQDAWQVATLGLSCVSNDASHARTTLARALAFREQEEVGYGEVVDCQRDLLSLSA